MMKKIGLGLACVLLLTPILWQLMPSTGEGSKAPDKCGRTEGPLYNIDRVFIYYVDNIHMTRYFSEDKFKDLKSDFKIRLEETIRRNFSACVNNIGSESFFFIDAYGYYGFDVNAMHTKGMFDRGSLIIYARSGTGRYIENDLATAFSFQTALFRPGLTDQEQFSMLNFHMKSSSTFPVMQKDKPIDILVQEMLDDSYRYLAPARMNKAIGSIAK